MANSSYTLQGEDSSLIGELVSYLSNFPSTQITDPEPMEGFPGHSVQTTGLNWGNDQPNDDALLFDFNSMTIQEDPKTLRIQQELEGLRTETDNIRELINLYIATLQPVFNLRENVIFSREDTGDLRNQLGNRSNEIIFQINVLIRDVGKTFVLLNEKLMEWTKMQRDAANFRNIRRSHLDTLQSLFENVFDIIMDNKEYIEFFLELIQFDSELSNEILHLKSKFDNILIQVVTGSVVIQDQPCPQVLKKKTGNISATVRLLLGNRLSPLMNEIPQFEVSIIDAAEARNPDLSTSQTCGRISNNRGTVYGDETTNQLLITFSGMQLEDINRSTSKRNELENSVACEKYFLRFSSNFVFEAGTFLPVCVLSLPVTVIVHVNQEPLAVATILWDNAFATQILCEVRDNVRWSELADVLSSVFLAFTRRPLSAKDKSRPLSTKDTNYLAAKVFRVEKDSYDGMVSWSQFAKYVIPDTTFSTWDWFYATAKLIRDKLADLFHNGLIMGFVSKRKAQDLLRDSPPGTFLLRFADSKLGGIVIAFVREGSDKQNKVCFLGPFMIKDLENRSLVDYILNDLHELQYLYPDIAKTVAFAKYYKPHVEHPTKNGYVKPVSRLTLDSEKSPQLSNDSIPMTIR